MRRLRARPLLLGAGLAALLGLGGLLGLAPYGLPDVWVTFLTGVFVWSAMAAAWDLMAEAGYISLATAGWYGLGAYSTAVLMNHFGLGFYASCLVSGVWIGLLAVAAGVPLLRLRSHYFIMGTFIIAEVVYLVVEQARVFGLQGATPVQLPLATSGGPEAFNRYFYVVGLVFLLIVLAVVLVVRRSRFGLALRAIGQDESAAAHLGVATVRYKLLAFGLSSAVMAFAGSIDAYLVGYLQQSTAFSLVITVKTIVIAIIGGLGAIFGPIVGAVVVQYIEQVLGPTLADLNQLVYGVIVIVIVVALPQGLLPGTRRGLPLLGQALRRVRALRRRGGGPPPAGPRP